MKTICPKCNAENEVIFVVKGGNLQDMVINFTCKGCGCPGTIIVEFEGDSKTKNTIGWGDTNYIG